MATLKNNNSQIQIFLNPVHTTLNITWTNSSSTTAIKVFDVNSRLVITKQTNENSVQQLVNGAYFLRLEGVNGTVLYNAEFVKE